MAMTLTKTKTDRPEEHEEEAPGGGPDEMERIIAERVAAEVQRLEGERATQIADEVAKQIAGLRESLTPGVAGALTDKGAMEALAVAIAGVTDQEVGRKRVPPEEMARRIRAREDMEKLIAATFERGAQPIYKLTQPCYLGEQLIQPYWSDPATKTTKATEVGWWSVPNEYMLPVNDEARAIHVLFLSAVDSHNSKRGASLRVTPGGLVVRSGGMNPEGGRDPAPRVGRDINQPSLAGRNGERPEVQTRILGTLMPPARQMV